MNLKILKWNISILPVDPIEGSEILTGTSDSQGQVVPFTKEMLGYKQEHVVG